MPATRRVDALSVLLMAAERAKRIGARMRERRDELGLTQPEVANLIGGASVTKDYISRWEKGKTEPSEAYLEEIAAALQTTVADLMAGPAADRGQRGTTPDLFVVEDTQLDRIERKLDELLRRQDGDASETPARRGAPPKRLSQRRSPQAPGAPRKRAEGS